MSVFDELSHNGLVTCYADGNRDVSCGIGIYRGNAAITVFTKQGKPTYRWPLNPGNRAILRIILRKMTAEPKACRHPIVHRKFEVEDKKWKPLLGVAIGIDENLQLYIESSGGGLSERYKFPVKIPSATDVSNADLTEKDLLMAQISMLQNVIDIEIPMGNRISSVKRTGGTSGGYSGGNRGGGSDSSTIEEDVFI